MTPRQSRRARSTRTRLILEIYIFMIKNQMVTWYLSDFESEYPLEDRFHMFGMIAKVKQGFQLIGGKER
jgi:hypothetical protein